MPDTTEVANSLAQAFFKFKDDPMWVASDANKAPHNSDGELFNGYTEPDAKLSTLAEAQATAAKFNLPYVGIIFPATGIVRDGRRLLCLDADEVKGYQKPRKAKPGAPGKPDVPAVEAVRFDPVADAQSVLARVPLVAQLPDTVIEASASCTGFHVFLWVDAEHDLWGRNRAPLHGCKTVDTFIAGRKPRHLALTGQWLTSTRTIAYLDDIEPLKAILQKAGNPNDAPDLIITDEGNAQDLTALPWLTDEQRQLVSTIGKGDFDRSPVMQSLLINLHDHNISPPDILASMCSSEALVAYLLDHRNQDERLAYEFAKYEIGRAYVKSRRYLQDQLAKYYPAWRDGEALAVADETVATEPRMLFKVRPLTLELLNAPVPPQECVITPHIGLGLVTEMDGGHGLGKSMLALDMVMHVALGIPWCGLPTKQGKAVFASREDTYATLLRRVQAWFNRKLYNEDPVAKRKAQELITKNLIILGRDETTGLRLTKKEKYGECIVDDEAIGLIAAACQGAVFIVLETVTRLNGGDAMNDLIHIDYAVELIIKKLGGDKGPGVLLIRHVTKAVARSKQKTDSYSGSGSAVLADAVRSVMNLRKLDDKEAKELRLPCLASADVLEFTHDKCNYAERHRPLYFLRLGEQMVEQKREPTTAMEIEAKKAQTATEQSERVLAYVREQNEVTVSDVKKNCVALGISKDDAEGILKRLELDGAVKSKSAKAIGRLKRGGPDYAIWQINLM